MSTDVGTESESVEERALGALDEGNYESATTLLLRQFGHEVFRFLSVAHRDEDDASDVFSAFAEALWTAIPTFERRSSLRTWMYAIARRTSLRHRRDARRRRNRFELRSDSALFDLELEIRTATLSFLRTERKTRLSALRASLPIEDQMLLVLRVDRRLSWSDLALVLHEGEDDQRLSSDELKREAARLRKRFQLLKDRLREQGRREGLVGTGTGES